jgi:hypothetical protein
MSLLLLTPAKSKIVKCSDLVKSGQHAGISLYKKLTLFIADFSTKLNCKTDNGTVEEFIHVRHIRCCHHSKHVV